MLFPMNYHFPFRLIAASMALLLAGSHLIAQPNISLSPFATGFNQPVEITHAGDSRLFVLERPGIIRIVDSSGNTLPAPFLDLGSQVRSSSGEQGLLGLAFPPDFATSGTFYINYTRQNSATRVARFQVSPTNPDSAMLSSEEEILSVDQPFANHNGGCLRFGEDGFLYIALGDGGSGGDPDNRAQTGQDLLGKILRIDVSQGNPYAIPADNPFVNDPTVADEVWTLGWRNPWKFSFDRETGDMWIADVGQNAREEINVENALESGGNYGWRCREGKISFPSGNCIGDFVEPIWDYPHGFNTGNSVTGGYVYRGVNHPDLVGHYVFGDYISGNFWTLFPAGGAYDTTNQGTLLSRNQLTSFGEDAQGELYVASKDDGTIYRIQTDVSASITSLFQPLTTAYLEDGSIRLSWENAVGPAQVEVFDLTGRLIRNATAMQGEYVLEVDFPQGIYLVRIHAGAQYAGKVLVR